MPASRPARAASSTMRRAPPGSATSPRPQRTPSEGRTAPNGARREDPRAAGNNVCKHRAHELLTGSGTTRNIVCPYHAWTYDLTDNLKAARRADRMESFDKAEFCLDQVQVEEFGGFVYVNGSSWATPSTLRT